MISRKSRWLATTLAAATIVTGCSTNESSVPASATSAPPSTSTSAPNLASSLPSTTTTTPAPPPTPAPPTTVPATTVPATTVPATTGPATTVPATAPASTVPPTTLPAGGTSVLVHRLPTDEPVVALTFDAGSDVGNTALVLDILSENGVPSSFGITGAFAEAHPDEVRRIAREGHVVMNHSATHFSFTGVSSTDVLLDTTERQQDLLQADAVLAPLVGASSAPFWRPPFGDYDDSVLADVGAIGYRYTVMWTIDSLGWRGLSPDQIVARVIDLAEPGAIVLMHVGSQSADAQALSDVIAGLRGSGYSFTTIAAVAG